MQRTYRIGQIVPSSNTAMETEVPAMLRTRERVGAERFTFHSSRTRMLNVTKEELTAMNADSERCAIELADARVDVVGYACLVAVMSQGNGYHRRAEAQLQSVVARHGCDAPIVSSAGAMIEGLKALNAMRIAIVAPYLNPLTQLVIDYIESEGIEVVDSVSLEGPDNLVVGRCDPMAPAKIYRTLDLRRADAVVLSSCVQMQSLPAIPLVEKECGLPVVSAAVCTTHQILTRLGLPTSVEGAGALLSGRY